MALFPAYEIENKETVLPSESIDDKPASSETNWLENSSFSSNILNATKPAPELLKSNKSHSMVKKRKKKSRHKPEIHTVEEIKPLSDEIFVIDKTRTKEYLSVLRIARPSAPRYSIAFFLRKTSGKRKKTKLKRYFHFSNLDKEESNVNTDVKTDADSEFSALTEEKDLSAKTAYFNRSLTDNPYDVDMWMKYVNFQDVVHRFQKLKGSIAKGSRVLAEKKLSVLDKALSFNSGCEVLLRERLNIAVSVFPADELQIQLKKLIERDSANIILWQGFIESVQCSMSHCNVPAVLKIYTKCLSTLHQLRRNATEGKTTFEENILRILYQCGLFLKQSGLSEKLWLLLNLYLEINLSPANEGKFSFGTNFNEQQLQGLEDSVLNSQLPIHELWLRIEKLRECCHWLPSTNENCEDPQRIVLAEDVVELVQPITIPSNMLKLTAIVLSLLKVPLLPCRHSTMHNLGLDYVPWALDSVELLLPSFYDMYGVKFNNKYLLKDFQKLAVGPQYLKTFPGQEEYLEFVLKTFNNCIDCLKGDEKTAVSIWYLRFQRLLIILDNQERCKISTSFKKKIKSSIKNFLKSDENRENTLFYQEYAFIDYELSLNGDALKILLTTLQSLNVNCAFDCVTDVERQIKVCSLYRSIIEMILLSNQQPEEAHQQILRHLMMLVFGKEFLESNISTENCMNDMSIKFKHVHSQLLQKIKNEKVEIISHFLPNLFIDWTVFYGWFLYITKGFVKFGSFMEENLIQLDESEIENIFLKEVLFEFYAAVLFRHCLCKLGAIDFKVVDNVLYRGIEFYPNNLFLLSAVSKVQSLSCFLGQSLFKISKVLLGTGRAIPSIFLILMAQQKISEMEDVCADTITGENFGLEDAYKNKVLALFKRLTDSSICTRRCGFLWRLYLQFLYSHFSPNLVRKAYYAAVEECPWLKALYMDAAIYIPAELAQIQDLLIEKQLRLHVTPEELDVLRT